MAQLVSWHSCVADRLPVVVRFPACPRVRLKTVDPPKGNGLGQKKIQTDMIFETELGPPFEALITNSVLVCVTLMRFAQLKKVLGWAQNRTSKEAPDSI